IVRISGCDQYFTGFSEGNGISNQVFPLSRDCRRALSNWQVKSGDDLSPLQSPVEVTAQPKPSARHPDRVVSSGRAARAFEYRSGEADFHVLPPSVVWKSSSLMRLVIHPSSGEMKLIEAAVGSS